ncbi:MAG: hypothetical protein R3E12_00300 [Candidatus Eisenbacteria bacterium]
MKASELRLAANPFVDANGAEGAIQVTAIIEWYYYGPTEAATKLLTGYAIGGLLGASLMGPGENAFTGAMQLRVQTSPPMTHAILVRVARDSDATKASRAEVLEAVAADAARYLLFRLGEALGSEGKVPFRAEAFAGSEAELVANWRVPSTGKLLN